MRGPKTRRELAVQLLVVVVPYAYVFGIGVWELSRARSRTDFIAFPGFLVLAVGLVGYSAWAIREYVRWSRGIRPAPARPDGAAFAPRAPCLGAAAALRARRIRDGRAALQRVGRARE